MGVDVNERLTATTGVVLVGLLAALGVTILSIGPLIWWHAVLGMLLIPPILLKLASTGWRFLRYYRRSPEYVRRGPPVWWLRFSAPLVVLSTLFVFGTGVALLVTGPSGGILVGLAVTALHVLGHLRELLPRRGIRGASWRFGALACSIVAGVILAALTARYGQPWVHWMAGRHGGDG
jgi:hypothetical protein